MTSIRIVALGGLVLALAACGGAEPAPATSAREGTETPARGETAAPTSGSGHVTATRGGTSCEAAKTAWADDAAAKAADVPKPSAEHDEELKTILNRGTYLNDCSVPETADVAICAAIVEGQARGVTVEMDGGGQTQADCVADAVGKIGFPKHETMSITKTRFSPGK